MEIWGGVSGTPKLVFPPWALPLAGLNFFMGLVLWLYFYNRTAYQTLVVLRAFPYEDGRQARFPKRLFWSEYYTIDRSAEAQLNLNLLVCCLLSNLTPCCYFLCFTAIIVTKLSPVLWRSVLCINKKLWRGLVSYMLFFLWACRVIIN
jgi:hypothetical protein